MGPEPDTDDDRDRNDQGRYADRIPPEAVLDVFDARDDQSRPLTAADVVDELEIARRTAHNKLNALVERGVLDTRKVGARGRVWWTPDRDGDLADSGRITPDERAVDEHAESARERDERRAEDQADPSASSPAATSTNADTPALDDALIEWEPDTEADAKTARAQTRRTVEYLRERAPERFKRGGLQDALAEDSTYSPRNWWERAVQPGLRHLGDVGLVEYRAGYHDYRWSGDGTDT